MYLSLLVLCSVAVLPLNADSSNINAYVIVLNQANLSVLDYRAISATFGDEIPDSGLRGRLEETEPKNACVPIRPASSLLTNDTDRLPWIALIQRTSQIKNCTFELKVLHAQLAGYKAAIIYNPISNRLITMQRGLYASQVHIPSVFISFNDFSDLRDNWISLPGYKIELHGSGNSNIYLIPFLVVISSSLTLIVIFFLIKWCRDYHYKQRSRLSKRHLKKLSKKKFCATEDPYECCAICLDDFVEGDHLRILPCNHAYHLKCVDPWLLKNRRNCPVCKRKIFSHKKKSLPNSEALGNEDAAKMTNPTVSSTLDSNSDESGVSSDIVVSNANERTPLLATNAVPFCISPYSSGIATAVVRGTREISTVENEITTQNVVVNSNERSIV